MKLAVAFGVGVVAGGFLMFLAELADLRDLIKRESAKD